MYIYKFYSWSFDSNYQDPFEFVIETLNRFLKNLTTFHYITFLKSLLWSNGGTASTSAALGNCLLCNVGSTSCCVNFACNLSEFGEVKSSNLFGFFNLLLVGLDLSLKSINQRLHALVILAVFIRCKCQLIYTSLRSAQVLQSIGLASAFGIQFRFQFTYTGLHFVHCLLASFKSIGFGFIQTLSHVLGLSFQNFSSFVHLLSNILFTT